ncbi:hypothetical protein [Streptomyces sp. NBC_00687]|uniref:hypothetical protein n=1 Tax=Streptomyces sp. NBC_00687 TaxID=2975807 RepID=UPI002254A345|nr:hypothetical protein [Streptomyces sp. NBC_00687]MCX4912834.1 hypothetical protein [Streptomyces sp. NBC_00687]
MPRKSKDPGEGACPSCRKSVPLVEGDRGSFVLRTHHVVVADPFYSGHGVAECEGSAGEPATLDDSEDWGWVAPPMAPVDGDTVSAVSAVGRALPSIGSHAVSLGEAIRTVTAEIIAEEHTTTDEQLEAVMQSSVNSRMFTASTVPRELLPDRVEVGGVDITDMITGPIVINEVSAEDQVLGAVLAAMRQAWIDVTGAPPEDATVTLSTPEFTSDVQALDITFQPYALRVSIPVHSEVIGLTGVPEVLAEQAGDTVSRLLRERLARCNATRGPLPCECNHPDREPHEHTCGVCRAHWRDPVTPTLHPDYIHGA